MIAAGKQLCSDSVAGTDWAESGFLRRRELRSWRERVEERRGAAVATSCYSVADAVLVDGGYSAASRVVG
jgi:hypothetical protein